MFKKSFLIIATFLVTSASFAQTIKFIDSGTVKNQFDYLLTESNNINDFKVVKQQWILKLKANVSDSISKSKNIIAISKSQIEIQKQEIDSLKNTLQEATVLIEKLTNEQQQMSFIGIDMDKTTFKTLVYSLILVFAVLFLIFLYKFKQSNTLTLDAKNNLKQLEEEFDEHRRNALEREQKAMRKLQDELNKQKRDS